MKISEILALREKAEKDKKKAATPRKQARPTVKSAPAAAQIKVLRTRETPNPSALQFVLNSQILDHGSISYSSRGECNGDKMALALFDLENVKTVYIMENFVTVTKEDDAVWGLLKDRVWSAIEKNAVLYQAGQKAEKIYIDVENFQALSTEEKVKAVEMVLDRSIRTNLAKDGGGVEVKGIDGNTVLILYQGACGSCPTSTTGTLQYIQGQLQQQLHRDLKVKPA